MRRSVGVITTGSIPQPGRLRQWLADRDGMEDQQGRGIARRRRLAVMIPAATKLTRGLPLACCWRRVTTSAACPPHQSRRVATSQPHLARPAAPA
jgi:hypothetical protein